VAASALFAHEKLHNVDWRVGLALGAGGILGAQLGARWVEHVSGDTFRKIFALVLVGLATRLFFFER